MGFAPGFLDSSIEKSGVLVDSGGEGRRGEEEKDGGKVRGDGVFLYQNDVFILKTPILY